jgi:acyl-CoA reductase-like NAD-dependent aldehyde dehydrogenase
MGQNCIGIERLLVHNDQYDDLWEIFSQRVGKMRVGSVMSMQQAGYLATVEGGAMLSNERFRGLEKLIKDANEANAYVIGGEEFKHPYHEHGYYFSPTVVGPVDVSMEIAQQERELINDNQYSLFALMFSSFLSFRPRCLVNALRNDRRSY